MTNKKEPEHRPPEHPIQSVQMDLFRQFLSNDPSGVSNTVEVWESIPKYFFTPRQVEKLRTKSGHADPFKWDFDFNGQPCVVRVQPAFIEQENGAYKAFFPSVTEELVEEALKKILTDQQLAIHDLDRSQTWVRFTLRMVQKELKNRNKTRSINQIKQAIEVMSSSVLTVFVGKKEVWRGAILQDLATVDREEYLSNTDSMHAARLPLFITSAINKLEYRQFNYQRLMNCKEQLSRWIYKRLINRYRQASLMNSYHFMYSDIKKSGLLQQAQEKNNRAKVISSLDELVSQSVVMSYKTSEVREGRKIVDIKYTLAPAMTFVSEQKAANKRLSDGQKKARDSGVFLVDN